MEISCQLPAFSSAYTVVAGVPEDGHEGSGGEWCARFSGSPGLGSEVFSALSVLLISDN